MNVFRKPTERELTEIIPSYLEELEMTIFQEKRERVITVAIGLVAVTVMLLVGTFLFHLSSIQALIMCTPLLVIFALVLRKNDKKIAILQFFARGIYEKKYVVYENYNHALRLKQAILAVPDYKYNGKYFELIAWRPDELAPTTEQAQHEEANYG